MKQLYRKLSLFLVVVVTFGVTVYVWQIKNQPTAQLPVTVVDIEANPTPSEPTVVKSKAGTQNISSNKPIKASIKDAEIVDSKGNSFPLRVYKPLALTDQVRPYKPLDMTDQVRTYKPLLTTDPSGDQWWTRKTGLDTNWADAPGVRQTVVAVIDTGFGLRHEEFTNRWAMNSGEQGPGSTESPSRLNCTDRLLPIDKSCNLIDDDYDDVVDNEIGVTTRQNPSRLNCTDRLLPIDKSCNLIDDDNNGFVDDVNGWDFANNDSSSQAGQTAPTGPGTTHGTQVSGVLAANGNNAKGIAGVDWSTRILPLQALDDEGYGNTLTVARAIYYAADRGVDVINLSLGTDQEDPYLRQAVQYAIDNGAIVVAASGNDGCDCMSYPARYPEVIAVGAESYLGGPTSFSSYGAELDIMAPGDRIATPTWTNNNPTAAYATSVAGTSFSAPYISGLLSRARSLQPNATWAELTNALLSKSDHTGLTVDAPTSPRLGSGYARADQFITRLKTPANPIMRYNFTGMSAGHPLSSGLVYQCEPTEFSTTKVYELGLNGDTIYTVNALENNRLQTNGWLAKSTWRACVGLAIDRPVTARNVNLLSEILNKQPDKTAGLSLSPRGRNLYVNPNLAQPGRPTAITSAATGIWVGDFTTDVRAVANQIVSASEASNSLATLVAYNIPARDCGSYSAGGANSSQAYDSWIRQLADGIGRRSVIVILEPDALAQIGCLTAADQASRYSDLSNAINILTIKTNAIIYIDAGHSDWISAATMAERLTKANLAKARGFSLNVSNFQTTANSINYGEQLTNLTAKPYVIDTSRNGRGPNGEFCNPAGRALGRRPTTTATGNLDAYLWVKVPGESDGACNGGPAAGVWWDEYANELVANSTN